MKTIKVVEFIKLLESIGFDENTELSVGAYNTNGDSYDFDFDDFFYGDELAMPNINEINLNIIVPDEYVKSEQEVMFDDFLDEIKDVVHRFSK